MTKEITIDVGKLAEKDKELGMLLNEIEKRDSITDIAKETEPKKYDKAYVVEDDMLWEVFGDGYSKAQVIWDKENICDLLNNLHQENQQLKHYKLYEDNKRLQTILADLKKENGQLRKENNFLKQIREAFQIDVKNSRQMLKGRDSDE